jgi:ABC-2 type transport system ATP-binding protein|tara:strand:- start:13 stop:939 length:927 start_codon:yes stop_codon:yes gene_type:complete
MNKIALSAEKLTKIYSKNNSSDNSILALNKLNLEVKQGEVFGLLGPNGAGKTTFINILGGTVMKTSGKINLWGFDLDTNPRQVRASIGIVPQEINLDAFFSPRKLLELQAGLYGVKKSERITNLILKMVSLEKQANSYARSLSGGMKRRLLIAKAMVHKPPVLVLDEPSAGVDVELKQNLWSNIKELNKIGVTILLTTHNLNEAQEMCDRIAIINKGNLVKLDTTKKLLEQIESKKIKFNVKNLNNFKKIILNGVKFSKTDTQIIATYDKNKFKFDQIIDVVKNNAEILDISTDDGDLEDIFLQVTNK